MITGALNVAKRQKERWLAPAARRTVAVSMLARRSTAYVDKSQGL